MCTAIRNSCDSYIYFLVATYIPAVYTKQKHLILQLYLIVRKHIHVHVYTELFYLPWQAVVSSTV